MLGSEKLESLLKLLGGLMDAEGTPEIRLVVSGGAALIAARFIERSTADIDVFAQRELEGDLIPGHPLPGWFVALVERVAVIERLPRKWINADTSLVGNGLAMLPSKCFQSLEETCYGSRLRVGFLNRDAQLYLKAYAIIGREELRDVADLRALRPGDDEIAEALDWMLENDLIDHVGIAHAEAKLKLALDESE